MFAEEKLSFQPLPVEPFRYYQYGERAMHLDGCVEVERASNLLTSNRPVEDWGKLLGDSAAVTAMLDRLLTTVMF
jgi:hypothetical protein